MSTSLIGRTLPLQDKPRNLYVEVKVGQTAKHVTKVAVYNTKAVVNRFIGVYSEERKVCRRLD